ncbi:MAG: SDR family NAD(P)-dependent oxidoreductase [Pseudomonadota bacterium]
MDTLEGQIALVTGSNRGLGEAFVDRLVGRGAAKVYAAARDIDTLAPLIARHNDVLVPVSVDVTEEADIVAAAERCSDVTLLISNAGVTCIKPILSEPTIGAFRRVMETNYFGPLMLFRSFAPVLKHNGGGAFLQVLSMAALMTAQVAPAYSASKAACNMLTHAMRNELAENGTRVAMSYPGFFKTRMSDGFEVPMPTPATLAGNTLDQFLAGKTAIFPDTFAKMVKQSMLDDMSVTLDDPTRVVNELVGAFVQHPQAGQ